jgi:hypothetical protein
MKTLQNFCNEDRVTRMEPRKVTMDKTIGFRSPDQEFCDALNHALEITGLTINDLCVFAVQEGLTPAVAKFLEVREKKVEFLQPSRYLKLPKKGGASKK